MRLLSLVLGVVIGSIGYSLLKHEPAQPVVNQDAAIQALEARLSARFTSQLAALGRTLAERSAVEVERMPAERPAMEVEPATPRALNKSPSPTDRPEGNRVEFREYVQRVSQEMYDDLDERLQQEPLPPARSPEAAIRSSLGELPDARITEVRCVATLCRVELLLQASQGVGQVLQAIRFKAPFSEGTSIRYDKEDDRKVTLYVHRSN